MEGGATFQHFATFCALTPRRAQRRNRRNSSIRNFDFWQTPGRINESTFCDCGGDKCDICIEHGGGRSDTDNVCEFFGDMIVNLQDDGHTDPRVLAHELGHYLLCHHDEYQDGPYPPSGAVCPPGVSCAQDGHTNMAALSSCTNASCTSALDRLTWCTLRDHGKDGVAGMPAMDEDMHAEWQALFAGLYSKWPQADFGEPATTFAATPVNIDFRDYNFQGIVGTVTLH